MVKLEDNQYYVYILKCSDDTLYTGITNDLEHRLMMHNTGKGAKYTKIRRPVILQYQEIVSNKSTALKREIEIKKLSRKDKLKLLGQKQ